MRTIHLNNFQMYCFEHHRHGPLPCPWPNCENGIDEDEFCQADFIGDSEREIFRRVRWQEDAAPYYSWVSNRLGAIMQIGQVTEQEALRRGLRSRGRGNLIYHYTTVAGLKGILDSNEVWLTDYSYLNDAKELNHGLELFESRIEQIISSGKHPKMEMIFRAWLQRMWDHQHRICITSYSLEGDSLSQWRAYGNVAIGFEPSYLLASGGSGETQFNEVIYAHDKQVQLIDLFLDHVAQAFRQDAENTRLVSRIKIEDEYISGVRWLVGLATLFKNQGFADEREVRVAYIENPKLCDSLGLKQVPKRFRATADSIIPYVTTKDILRGKSNELLPIREIIVGPSITETSAMGIKEYLAFLGLSEVEVKRSKIPFRSY